MPMKNSSNKNLVEGNDYLRVDGVKEFFERPHHEHLAVALFGERYRAGQLGLHYHFSGIAGASLIKFKNAEMCVTVEPCPGRTPIEPPESPLPRRRRQVDRKFDLRGEDAAGEQFPVLVLV